MPYEVYVLKSLSQGSRYIGSTENIDKRLDDHNSGKCRYTKGRRLWKIIHTKEYATRAEAMKREKFLKTGQGRKFLDKILN